MKTKGQRIEWVENNGIWHIMGQHISGESEQGKRN